MSPIGVEDFGRLPRNVELGPPDVRCCHGCGRERGEQWIAICHSDLTWWKYPLCFRCVRISGGCVLWGQLQDEVERRFAERCIAYVENHMRYLYKCEGRTLRPFRMGGIYEDVWRSCASIADI